MPLPYSPPPLDKRILIRDPADRPIVDTDEFGRLLSVPPEWGKAAWAARSERSPQLQLQEGTLVQTQAVVWTIRHRRGLAPNVEIVYDDEVYVATGRPVVRGGAGHGRATMYSEIHTVFRARRETVAESLEEIEVTWMGEPLTWFGQPVTWG